MAFTYEIIPLPPVWPGTPTPPYAQRRAPFKSLPGRALAKLGYEIARLNGKHVRIAIDVTSGQIRTDGMLKASSRPSKPAVIVSFEVSDGVLQFPCDTFKFWEANVDAIGRALEALRMINRYGVQQGKQYTGFKALPATTTATMNTDEAAHLLGRWSNLHYHDVLQDVEIARKAARAARYHTHPDRNGGNVDDESAADFHNVTQAVQIVATHHGLASL